MTSTKATTAEDEILVNSANQISVNLEQTPPSEKQKIPLAQKLGTKVAGLQITIPEDEDSLEDLDQTEMDLID